jgi:hypothetical protein
MSRINLHPKFNIAPRRAPIRKPPAWFLAECYPTSAETPEPMSRAALVATFAILVLTAAAILAQHQWHFLP